MKKTILFIALALSLGACGSSPENELKDGSNGEVKLESKNKTVKENGFLSWSKAMDLCKMPSVWEWLRFFGEDCKDGDMEFLENFVDEDGLSLDVLKQRGWAVKDINTPEATLVHMKKGVSLPLAGLPDGSKLGSDAYYWSSTPDGSSDAWVLIFDSGGLYVGGISKSNSFSVYCLE